MTIENDADGLGLALQEYAHERFDVSRGRADATAWIEESDKLLEKAVSSLREQ